MGYRSGPSRLVIAIFVGIGLILLTWLEQWAWWSIVPDIASGMVMQGMLPAELNFSQAFFMNVFAILELVVAIGAILAGLYFLKLFGRLGGWFAVALAIGLVLVILAWFEQLTWSIMTSYITPGMISHHLLPAELTFWQAFKLVTVPVTTVGAAAVVRKVFF